MFGALRSGTTLLRLMMVHHSRIHSPGEADYLFDHLSADSAAPHGWACDRESLAGDWKFDMARIDLPEGPAGGDLVYALTDIIQAQEPGNIATVSVHRKAPAMASLFPNAKYIHLLRDPRDSARSAVGMGWDGNSYYGVRHWLDTEANWDLTQSVVTAVDPNVSVDDDVVIAGGGALAEIPPLPNQMRLQLAAGRTLTLDGARIVARPAATNN